MHEKECLLPFLRNGFVHIAPVHFPLEIISAVTVDGASLPPIVPHWSHL